MRGSNDIYTQQLSDVFMDSIPFISNLKPADWTEQNVIMQKPFPGPFTYARTPYTREIINRLSLDDPARWIAVMKGAQIGFSAGVIIPGCGWLMKNNPGNTIVTVGSPDLVEKAVEKLDLMIDSAGLRAIISPQVQRNRANKSGDTNNKKEFPSGYIYVAAAGNHKAIRQMDLQYGFFDDFESVITASKQSGNTRKLLEQRFAAYNDTKKIFYISTPELKQNSNIEAAYLLGDQRKYLIPCEHCGAGIELKWSIKVHDFVGGITWKVDNNNKLIRESVGYICQECGGFFTDKNKQKLLNDGIWTPSAEPKREGYFSYHISSLYAPIGMDDWEHYINNFIEANPFGQPRKEDLYKTFVNVCLGETYQQEAEAPKANSIQKNIRQYDVGMIPENMSMNDGNGRIVLITVAADMNGKIDDARVDYEVIAWAENGTTYSISHGSIGTFIPREGTKKVKEDRLKWSYERHHPQSVWPELDKILESSYQTDTKRKLKMFMCGLDCGHFTTYAYDYIDSTPHNVVGVKGDKEDRYIRFGIDVKTYKPARERPKLYIVQIGLIKDDISEYMKLRWIDPSLPQPANFMNYPTPGNGLYGFSNFFEHYESEQRVVESTTDGVGVAAKWEKKNSTVQNHMWDSRVYNYAVRDIIVDMFGKAAKMPTFMFKDLAKLISSQIK